MNRDRMAELIPWYVNGTLGAEERKQLEEYLRFNAESRELLAHAQACAAHADRSLEKDDVQAQLLLEYVEREEELDPSVRRAIREHLEGAAASREAAAIVREIPAAVSSPEVEPVVRDVRADSPSEQPSLAARVWEFLGSTILRPAPALAYLLVAGVLLVPTLRTFQDATPEQVTTPPVGEPAAATGPAAALPGPVLVLPGETRLRDAPGEVPAPEPAKLPAGGPQWVALQTDIDDWIRSTENASLDLELGADETGLLSIPVSEVDVDGTVRVLLFPDRLPVDQVTELRLRLRAAGHAMDGRVLYRRGLEVEAR
ncbi:hypothetical protein ABI59_12175 [Acidobacteria bacterium Mor1]|nr:hypothetical protein ABI59_12175 [Acidobacteria bacterium Mor1]